PTQNTDDTPITDLAGFRFYQGTSAGSLNNMVQVPGANCAHTFSGLSAGTNYFAVSAYNLQGVEGLLSSVVTKANTASATVTASRKLNVSKALKTIAVTNTLEYDVQRKGINLVVGRAVGEVPIGTAAVKDPGLPNGYCRIEGGHVTFSRAARSGTIVAKCG